jgi:Cu(I)/Ag(I) efflux system periplasmic protein CusF
MFSEERPIKFIRWLILSFALAIASPSLLATNHEPSVQLTEGEVRKVDKDAKKITIKHAPIVYLDMPAMTMVFQVKDSTLLEKVKPGDKIKFTAEKTGGAFTLTTIETMK